LLYDHEAQRPKKRKPDLSTFVLDHDKK